MMGLMKCRGVELYTLWVLMGKNQSTKNAVKFDRGSARKARITLALKAFATSKM